MHQSIVVAILLALSAQRTYGQDILATQCYYKSDNTKHTSTGGPCGVVTPNGNFSSCCAIGDTCLADGLCHYTHPKPAAPNVVTGYYVGGCTDSTLSSTACNPSCSDLDLTDIVYNQTTKTWACCGTTNGIVHCGTPTLETFKAPAPSALSATYTVPSTVATGPASSSSVSSSSSSTATGTGAAGSGNGNGNNGSGGLSTGAQAGIGVGCAIAGLAMLGLLGWLFLRRRRRHTAQGAAYGPAPKDGPFTDYKAGGAVGAQHEMTSPENYNMGAPGTASPAYGGYNNLMVGGGMNKSGSGVEGMGASVAGGSISGVGANGAPVETEPQELANEGANGGEVRRGRSVRHELE